MHAVHTLDAPGHDLTQLKWSGGGGGGVHCAKLRPLYNILSHPLKTVQKKTGQLRRTKQRAKLRDPKKKKSFALQYLSAVSLWSPARLIRFEKGKIGYVSKVRVEPRGRVVLMRVLQWTDRSSLFVGSPIPDPHMCTWL
jgi:hypothetical protein